MKMKSEYKHYFVGKKLFIDYMDAFNYCVENSIDSTTITSSYYY